MLQWSSVLDRCLNQFHLRVDPWTRWTSTPDCRNPEDDDKTFAWEQSRQLCRGRRPAIDNGNNNTPIPRQLLPEPCAVIVFILSVKTYLLSSLENPSGCHLGSTKRNRKHSYLVLYRRRQCRAHWRRNPHYENYSNKYIRQSVFRKIELNFRRHPVLCCWPPTNPKVPNRQSDFSLSNSTSQQKIDISFILRPFLDFYSHN